MGPDFTHLLSSRLGDSSVMPPVAAQGQVVAVDNSVAVVKGGACSGRRQVGAVLTIVITEAFLVCMWLSDLHYFDTICTIERHYLYTIESHYLHYLHYLKYTICTIYTVEMHYLH